MAIRPPIALPQETGHAPSDQYHHRNHDAVGRPRARLADAAVPRGVCPLRVILIGAGTLAAHPADPAPAPAASPTAGPAADRAPSQSSLQSGIAAAEAGRLSEAITILTPHAKRRDATANYTLGLIYMRGTGDAATAARLSHKHFENAAQRGHVGAVFEVAFQFERGIGTERDVKRAIRLYRLAAQSNHLNAQYNLAVLLSNGGGVEPDLPQAYFWAKAAHHNAIRSPNPVLTESRTRGLQGQLRKIAVPAGRRPQPPPQG